MDCMWIVQVVCGLFSHVYAYNVVQDLGDLALPYDEGCVWIVQSCICICAVFGAPGNKEIVKGLCVKRVRADTGGCQGPFRASHPWASHPWASHPAPTGARPGHAVPLARSTPNAKRGALEAHLPVGHACALGQRELRSQPARKEEGVGAGWKQGRGDSGGRGRSGQCAAWPHRMPRVCTPHSRQHVPSLHTHTHTHTHPHTHLSNTCARGRKLK